MGRERSSYFVFFLDVNVFVLLSLSLFLCISSTIFLCVPKKFYFECIRLMDECDNGWRMGRDLIDFVKIWMELVCFYVFALRSMPVEFSNYFQWLEVVKRRLVRVRVACIFIFGRGCLVLDHFHFVSIWAINFLSKYLKADDAVFSFLFVFFFFIYRIKNHFNQFFFVLFLDDTINTINVAGFSGLNFNWAEQKQIRDQNNKGRMVLGSLLRLHNYGGWIETKQRIWASSSWLSRATTSLRSTL